MYDNQWRIGLNAGKTSSARPDISLIGTSQCTARPSALSPPASSLASLSTPGYPSPNTSMLSPTLLVTAFSNSYLYLPPPIGPSPSTTIKLLNTYICTRLEYGSAATCVANPSRLVQWERLQMRLITKTLDLPNALNHDILRRHADEPTIHDRLLYLAKRWKGKAYENNTALRDFIHNHTLYYAGKRRRIPDEILKQ